MKAFERAGRGAGHDGPGPFSEVILDAIRYRRLRGLSQAQLAKRMGRQQPAIARLEAGRVSPSLSFLADLAGALDLKLSVRLEPVLSDDQVHEDSPARKHASREIDG